MAEFNPDVKALLSEVDNVIYDPKLDLRQFSLDPNKNEYHTHTIDDIPQLSMLFNTGRLADVYDSYHNKELGNGFVLYSNRLLINYGVFTYDNQATFTKVILPMGYDTATAIPNYNLQISKMATNYNQWSYMPITMTYVRDDDRVLEQIDQSYNVYLVYKDSYSFIVKCNQLYMPERISYNYFTIGLYAQ